MKSESIFKILFKYFSAFFKYSSNSVPVNSFLSPCSIFFLNSTFFFKIFTYSFCNIFSFLTKAYLVSISREYGYKGLFVLTKDGLIQKLLNDRAIKKADVINQLKQSDLKSLCLRIGLNPNGS